VRTIASQQAPRAIGPYSQAVEAGGFLFTAGQIPLDPVTMALVSGDVAAQTERVFDNLEAVLRQAGLALGDVVKATVFLADMDDFPRVNEVYARRFGEHRPARSTVAVARLPKDARIEIDLVAKVRG
jgi:2-iminobutanoate/2-iminopropanoate deaminase